MTSVGAILVKVRVALSRRNARIEDTFTDFDRLRSGNITKDQFTRCLTISGVAAALSPEELQQLTNTYASDARSNTGAGVGVSAIAAGLFVNYQRFLRDVSAEDPPSEFMSPTTRAAVKTLAPEDEMALHRAYQYFAQRVNATELDVPSVFKDFDKYNTGRVTKPQFERSFPFQVDPKVKALIVNKYLSPDGLDVSYIAWCRDLEPLIAAGSINRTAPSLGGSTTTGGLGVSKKNGTAEEVLAELRSQVLQNRLRCDDFLRDYDKLRTGLITASQFAAALGRMRLVRYQLSAEEINALAEYFGTVDNAGTAKVNYQAFLDVIQPNTVGNLTKGAGVPATSSTLSGTNNADVDGQLKSRNGYAYGMPMTREEDILANKTLDKVRAAIQRRRMNLRPTFHDFDRTTKGIYRTHGCTRSRFERALAVNSIELSVHEVNLLVKKYGTKGADGQQIDINYPAFCDDVDMPTAEINVNDVATSTYYSQQKALANGTSDNNSNSPLRQKKALLAAADDDSLDVILTRLMKTIIERRVRLAEFLRDNDPLRTGTVPKDRFLSSIITSKVNLTAKEMDVLCEEYQHPRVPGHVDITRFLKDVDTGVVMGHPAEAPTDREVAVKERLLETTMGTKAANDNMRLIQAVLRRIADDVKARGVLLPPFFRDYDKHRCGKVTKSQFHQTISRHRFPASEAEVKLLKDYYEDPVDAEYVRYRDFVGDVDEAENVELQLSIRHGVRGNANNSINNNTTETTDGAGQGSDISASAVTKVANAVQRRNIRLEEFFKDGDALRKGFVSSHRFRHAIDIVGITLAEPEMLALESAFASDKEPGAVSYVDFLTAVRNTKAESLIPSMTSEKVRERSELEEKLLERLQEKVARAFGSRRVASRQVLQDYDKLHKGRVPEGHFFTALLSVGLNLTPVECQSLKKAYATGDGSMAYGEFCNKIDNSLQSNW